MTEKTTQEKTFGYIKEYIAKDRALPEEFRVENDDFHALAELTDEELIEVLGLMTEVELQMAIQLSILGIKLIESVDKDD